MLKAITIWFEELLKKICMTLVINIKNTIQNNFNISHLKQLQISNPKKYYNYTICS